ncbi:hypothetical protein JNB_05285 [Janibacter sp. HTCC2649]|uniref:hypothetical protein n=1 Tax=Janibacter sp. HTCC2649 TaxID=313589 RepID=UPI000066EBB1|nr:hypothetical protein [Janibacter sp. HTCC2649]EAP99559.1 hypothetical protein JNB_05285 [Janibacter sp. HTCC2649]
MSPKTNPALDRRTAIRVGAVGAVATTAAVATATTAGAAAGQAVLAGRANSAGTAGTTLTTSSTAIGLTVKNTGAGAGAFFFAQNNNGFAGGTGSGSKYGLSAANTGPTAGNGAGLAASGINNTGILANTSNPDRFAIEAVNLASTSSVGGGLLVDGGEANAAIVAVAAFTLPALISVGDTFIVEGQEVALTRNSVVWGATSADGNEVNFSAEATLDGMGTATVDLTGPILEDVNFYSSRVFVTPNSGPMPNLWISRTTTGAHIQGGTAGGTVSWRIVAYRTDLPGFVSIPTGGKQASPDSVAQVRRTVAAAKDRARKE